MRLDHLLSKESTTLTIVPSNDGTEQGDSQLVHWLLVPETATSVGDSVLTLVVRSWARRSLFRFEGVHRTRSDSATNPARPPRAPARRVGVRRPGQLPLENCIASTSIFVLPSYKEPTVDALASTTDEGRVWLRKATGSRLEGFDPWVSEWGNPPPVMGWYSGLNT